MIAGIDGGDDTIFALSSGVPPAAIAVMRISGSGAADVLRGLAGGLPPPRRASLRALHDPADGSLLDHALILWFPGPATATGEDLAELHLHGGRAVVRAVAGVLAAMRGLRGAEPGEFTRRAFLNGRIDLAAAEGLSLLLTAETETQRRAALEAAGGALGREVEGWRHRLLGIAAGIEALLDFADEDDVAVDLSRTNRDIGVLAADITVALRRPPAERLRDGVRVVIAGPPNAGKSTLLNALVDREAAIVSPVAGTTRDRIDVPVAIAGIPLLVTDTAGLHGSDDMVERIGIERAHAAMAGADILLWLGDDPSPSCAAEVIALHARCDRTDREHTPAGRIAVSAMTGQGVGGLRAHIVEVARAMLPRPDEAVVNGRQHGLLASCHAALIRSLSMDDPILIAEDLRAARGALDAITGRAGVEDLLDSLFSGFCIGK